MVDMALPKCDRVDLLDDDERANVAAIEKRLNNDRPVARTPAKAKKKKPKKKSTPKAVVTLSRDQWERLIRSMPAAPPAINAALCHIRSTLGEQAGDLVSVAGSENGWSTLLNYSLNKGVGMSVAAAITPQVSKAFR